MLAAVLTRRRIPVVLAVLAAALGAAACGGADDERAEGTATGPTASVPTVRACEPAEPPVPRGEPRLRPPKRLLDPAKTWTATVTTNCGAFTITLDARRAPTTASSFAALARRGFYDGLSFHRIAPGFVIQGGDPLGNGQGGPGYTVEEPPPDDLAYTHGVVAMAKTATDPDGTSGSQFFIVTAEDAQLPPQYALLGQVTEGLDVVDLIGQLPLKSNDPQGDEPVDPVVIERVEVGER